MKRMKKSEISFLVRLFLIKKDVTLGAVGVTGNVVVNCELIFVIWQGWRDVILNKFIQLNRVKL